MITVYDLFNDLVGWKPAKFGWSSQQQNSLLEILEILKNVSLQVFADSLNKR